MLVATAETDRLGTEVEVKASFFLGHAHLSGAAPEALGCSDLSGKTLILWISDVGLNPICPLLSVRRWVSFSLKCPGLGDLT